jgi:hypothetical protein
VSAIRTIPLAHRQRVPMPLDLIGDIGGACLVHREGLFIFYADDQCDVTGQPLVFPTFDAANKARLAAVAALDFFSNRARSAFP